MIIFYIKRMKTAIKVLGNYWDITIESDKGSTISTVEFRGFGDETIIAKTYFNPFRHCELKGMKRGKSVFDQYHRVHTIVLEVLLDSVLKIDKSGLCAKTSLRFRNLKIDFYHDGAFIWGDCSPVIQSKINQINHRIYKYSCSQKLNINIGKPDNKLKYDLDELLCLIARNN